MDKKTKYDRILLFYTENSPHVSYPDLEYICQYHDTFEMIRCNTGKNALDFQLVSYLGYLLKSAPKTRYIIFSNDMGYDSVVQFWNGQGISVSRIGANELQSVLKAESKAKETKNLPVVKKAESKKKKNLPAVKVDNAKEKVVNTMVDQQNMPEKKAGKVREILLKEDWDDLRNIHNDLVKSFGMEEGSQLYKQLKPEINKAGK